MERDLRGDRLLGADTVRSAYWMVSQDGRFRQRGYAWTDERRRRFLDVVGTVVDGIETGTFPALPGDYNPFWRSHDNCSFCDFDDLCPRDRDDYEFARRVLSAYGTKAQTVLFSPVAAAHKVSSGLDPAQLAAWILEDRLPVRLQLQLHKVLWPGKSRGI